MVQSLRESRPEEGGEGTTRLDYAAVMQHVCTSVLVERVGQTLFYTMLIVCQHISQMPHTFGKRKGTRVYPQA